MENFPNSKKIIGNQIKKESDSSLFESFNRGREENCTEPGIAINSPVISEDFPSSTEILDIKSAPSVVLSSLNFQSSVESSSVGDIPPPSSVSSSSSSLAEQGDFNIQFSYKTSSYDGNSSSILNARDENSAPEVLTTPLLKRRGPGRPRKDGNVSTVTKKKIISNPLTKVNVGRPRGRKRLSDRNQLGGLLSGISAHLNESFKMEDSSVSLISQLLDNQEKFELPELDSDNSMSSAISLERFPSDEIISEQWIGKTCSFCNLGEKSLLGQGDLTRFDPTTGFNPFRKSPKSRRGSTESERDLQLEKSLKTSWKRPKGRSQSKSPRRSDEDSNWQIADELNAIGFAEEPDASMLFEPSGHTYAHHCCASWSDGVCQTEDYVLINVDKAVIGGINQRCSNCQRFGASIKCREPKCNKIYHYPCAASSGTFQDIKSLTLLCPIHLHLAPSIELSLKGDIPRHQGGDIKVQGHITDVNNTADSESNCIVCDTPGNISELLFCTSCGHHYHGQCLDPVVAVNPVVRSGWQCPDCKICHTCRQPGDDNKMLVCDTCDKSYHTYCLKPVMTSIPKHGWKCKSCRVCGDCGARTPGSGPSSRWHMNYSVCDSCYQQRNKGLACLLCLRAYRHFAQKEMIMCTGCKKYVHGKCDKEVAHQFKDGDLLTDYLCPQCRKSPKFSRIGEGKDLPAWTVTSFNMKSISDDCNVPDNGGVYATSQDSSIPTNEDSFCSMDIDIQAIERSAQQLQQLSGNSNFDLLDDFPANAGKVYPLTLPNHGKLSGKKRMGIGRPRGGSKFVGIKRRGKTADIGKRRGPKPKLKPTFGLICPSPMGESSPAKLEEEPVLENKIVLCSAKDEFVLCQDMCIMCGSYGQGEEGRLISCSQCGQCYHPYCVSIKVNKVLLSKGWRCLDCTVCEGCGQPHDEGRLLLCDDCDISYHIYCLDPPLEQVPQGNWKCKWCVVCQHCGATDPGFNCQWQNNYTQCGPCSSHLGCPVCQADYKEDDLLIQCAQCDRWLHAGCDEMTTEEDAEKSADYGYHCILCRPKSQPPPHLLPPPPPSPPKSVELKPPSPLIPKPTPELIPVKVKSHPVLLLDGVYLSESGMSQIKSLTLEQPKKPRVRRSKSNILKSKQGCENEDSLDQAMDVDKQDNPDDELMKDSLNQEDVPVEKKKRQRNLQKLGVGGFVVRCRGRNMHKDDKDESVFGDLGDNPIQEGLDGSNEKPKRRRRMKKKSQLEDSFPAYLQEAFFGKDLLVISKGTNTKLEVSSDEEMGSPASMRVTHDKIVQIKDEEKLGKREVLVTVKSCQEKEDVDEMKSMHIDDIGDADPLKDILPLPQDLPQDDDLVKILMNDDETLSKAEVLEPVNGSDVLTTCETTVKDEVLIKDDPLTDILSPHFNIDTMVADNGLPQIDSKEVEDLFKGVLTDNLPQGSTDSNFRVGSITMASQINPAMIDTPPPQHPVPRPPIPANVAMSSPFSVPPPSPYPSEYSSSSQFSPAFSEPPQSPWVPPEPEMETQSYNQRNLVKWEKDEVLGVNATISAVLYANTNHPDLKTDYPIWSDRSKQMAKIWRALPSEKRTPYVQKARENRTASRIQKTQQMKDSGPSTSSASAAAANTTPKQGKRPKQGKTPPAPAPAPEPVEPLVDPNSPRRPPPSLPPSSINEKEQERMVREQKAHREQEQERQWKQLQAFRQYQAQQQQQSLQEQRTLAVPSQQPHPLPAMARVQQQMMSNEQLIKSPTSCGSITPTTPSSPSQMEPFGSTHPATTATANSAPVDAFCPPPVMQSQSPMMTENAVQQVRMAVPEQLHGAVGVNPLSPNVQQTIAISRTPGPFTPPIQVSRVRPPIDTSQVHVNMRMPSNDPYAQMPGTPRPSNINLVVDSFNRPLGHHSPMSPHVRSPVRIPDSFVRQPFVPRGPSPNDSFSGAGQNQIASKPHLGLDIYSKPPLVVTSRPQNRDAVSPATPRTPDVFHTPPSTPHTPGQDSYQNVSSEAFNQPPVVSSNHSVSPFSPSHSSHSHIHSQDQYNHSSPHTPRSSDSYSQQPATPRADPYAQQPPTPRADPYAQLPPTPRADPYAQQPPTPRTDPYAQQPPTPRADPYAQQPPTPRADPYAQQPPTPRADPYAQQPPTPRADPYAQQPPTPRPSIQQLSDMFGMPNQPRVIMSPGTRPNQIQQQDAFGQSPRLNDQFQVGGEPRPRPKMSPIAVHYSSTSEQPPQGMEHYGQQITQNAPRLNPSPIDDPYAQSPMTSRPLNSPSVTCSRPSRVEQVPLEIELCVNQGANSAGLDQDQTQQLSRQQLRDLLQKQQIRKQEPMISQGQPLRHWPLDQGQETESNQTVIHPTLQECIRMPGTHIIRQQVPEMPRQVMSPGDNSFRQPYPPGVRPRHSMGTNSPGPHQLSQQLHGQPQALINQFRHPGQVLESRQQGPNVGDPQMRLAILQQQQRLAHASQLRSLNANRLSLNIQPQDGSNMMDPYGQIVQQQRIAQNQQQQMSPNQMRMFAYQNTNVRPVFVTSQSQMQSSQPRLVSTTSSSQTVLDYGVPNIPVDTISQQQLCDANDQQFMTGVLKPVMQIPSSPSMVMSGDNMLHSDLGVGDGPHETSIPGVPLEGDPSTAEKVAEELQRIEKESVGDLQPKLEDPDDDLDDDELLGLGNDFNILEYADPELDKDIVGDGKKTNILDENLDLDDKDEDLEDDEVKTKVDSPGDRVSDIKVEIEGNPDQHMDITSKDETLDELNKQGSSSGLGLGKSDFQAKFLEFSQKRELEKAEELKSDHIFEEENIELNSSHKSGELDIKPNIKSDLNMGEMLHNMPSATFTSVTSTPNILPENPVQTVMTSSSVCQMPNMPSNQMYMTHEGVGNQMIVMQRPMRPQFSQQLMQGPPELRHQLIAARQLHPGVKIPLPPPPPPYPGVRPPPPYQQIRSQVIPGQGMPPQQMINRGAYNPMIGFRSQQPGQMQPHGMTLNMNPGVRQTQMNEQRLLLADLLEQEKLELRRQQQQQQHSNLLTHTHPDGLALSDLDFEKLKEDVFATGGSSLSPPGSGNIHLSPHKEHSPSQVLSPSLGLEHDNSAPLNVKPVPTQAVQQNLSVQMVGLHHQPSQAVTQLILPPPPPRHNNPMMDAGVHPTLMQGGGRPPFPVTSIPPPQTPPAEIVTESDRQVQSHYERWLFQQQNVISAQLKYFETEVGKLRKTRKSLNTKKRNLAKTGGQLNETDTAELERITREQTSLQKQLEQVRKQSRQHQLIMQEYHTKQQKQQPQQQLMTSQQMSMQQSPHSGAVQSPMINGPSTPMSPLMSPSPLGPSQSPLRQQSPSPMMQHSPLASSHSPLVQHPSPLGQQVYHQQVSPRHVNPNLNMDQPMRSSGIQSSPLQEDNNPFSDNFQHRELRPASLGPRPPQMGFQDDIEDRKPFRDQSCSPNTIQRWNQPIRGMCSSDQNIKLMPRGFHSSIGPRMTISASADQMQQQVLYQQQSVSSSTGSVEGDMSHCSSGLQTHLSPNNSMGHSPTHYALQSQNCSQPDRNMTSTLGSCIPTSSPSTPSGNSIETSVSSLVQSTAESYNLTSQPHMMSNISQSRVNESASTAGHHHVNQETIATSLGMLLSDNSTPMRRVFTNSIGPNSDQVTSVMQSGREESSGNKLNVESNGSCVGVNRVPLRKPSSTELLSPTSSTTIDSLQTSRKLTTSVTTNEIQTKNLTDSELYDISKSLSSGLLCDQTNLLSRSESTLSKRSEIEENGKNLNAVDSTVICDKNLCVNMPNMNEKCNHTNDDVNNLETKNGKSRDLTNDLVSMNKNTNNSHDYKQSEHNSLSCDEKEAGLPGSNDSDFKKNYNKINANTFGGSNPHSHGENHGPRGSGGGASGNNHPSSASGNNSNTNSNNGSSSGGSEGNNQQSSSGSSSGGNNPNDGNNPPNRNSRNDPNNPKDKQEDEEEDDNDDEDDDENKAPSSNVSSNFTGSSSSSVNCPTLSGNPNQIPSHPQCIQSTLNISTSNINIHNLIASLPIGAMETVSSTSSTVSLPGSQGMFFRVSGDSIAVRSSANMSAAISTNIRDIPNSSRESDFATLFSNSAKSDNNGGNGKSSSSLDNNQTVAAEKQIVYVRPSLGGNTISLLEGDSNAQVSSSDNRRSHKLATRLSKSPGLGSNFKFDLCVSSTNSSKLESAENASKSDDNLVSSSRLEGANSGLKVAMQNVKLENLKDCDRSADCSKQWGSVIDSTTRKSSFSDEEKLNFARSEGFKQLVTKQEPEQSQRAQFMQQTVGMVPIKIENAVSTTSNECMGSSTLGLPKPFSISQPRPSGTLIRMPLHMTQRMSLATQLSTQLDVLTATHSQPFIGGGRGLSRGHLVPSVQPRFTDQANAQKLELSSTTSSSTVTSGVPRVSQVGIPNPMGGRGQPVISFTQSSVMGKSQENSIPDDENKIMTGSGTQVVVKQEMLPYGSSAETSGEGVMKLPKVDQPSPSCSKMVKEKRIFNFALAVGHLEGASKSEVKLATLEGQECSTPQNALLKQLLQTSQPSPQFSKKQDKPEPPQQPTSAPPPLPPPPIYDTAAEVIASVAQLPPSPDHSHSSNECGLTEEERNRISLDEIALKQSDTDGTVKGKRNKGAQAKRQTKPKQNKEGGPPAKKRARKCSNPKPEEDYDGCMESLRVQMQALPSLRILEPDIQPNFSVCPVYGSRQLPASTCKLSGNFGSCTFGDKVEFYLDNPNSATVVPPPTPPPQRGFYIQEFPSRYSPPDEQRLVIGPDIRRSVDIPGSILTPPPCINDKPPRDFNSPDLILSSSSPECSLLESPCRYPYLKLIEDDDSATNADMSKSASPQVPLYFPIPIRARPVSRIEKRGSFDFDDDDDDDDPSLKDKENIMIGDNKAEKEALLIRSKLGFRPPVPLRDSANVSVTLTLTSSAAEDIRGVLSAVADLLKISAPLSFEITERTVTPPSQKMGLYKRGKDPSANMQSFFNGQPKFCRHCDVIVMNSGIKKKWSEMSFVHKDEQDEDEVMFCSSSCYMQFALSHRSGTQIAEKEVAAVVDHLCNVLSPSQSRMKTKSASSSKSSPLSESSKDDMKNEDSQGSNRPSSETIRDALETTKDSSITVGSKRKEPLASPKDSSSSTSTTPLGKSPRKLNEQDLADESSAKRWKGSKWKRWTTYSVPRPTYTKPSEDEINAMLDRLDVCIKPKKLPADSRTCVLCQEVGDGATNGAARLLNVDVDKWVHLNCALWSSEVYETVNGALMNVDIALKRGFSLDCILCKKKGATLGCFRLRCTNIYHFTCAIKDKCMFFKDKTLLCPLHIPKVLTPEMKENELHNLAVSRRVYVNRDENKQVASMMHRGDCSYLLRVGNLMFLSIGQLLPHQLQAFHSRNFIYPVGYKIIRMYWSLRNIGKRCQYVCSIQDNEGRPEFHVQIKEIGYSDLFIQARTARGVWQQIIEPIDKMRREANAIKVFTAFITGEDLFGLSEPSILRVLESLPGVETLSDYNFKYGRSPLLDLPLAINPTGTARAEPKLRTHYRRPHTLHTSSSSRSSFQVAITGLETTCPYSKQFIHSKASQYRKMKVEWRNNVYLARSRIQGLGLYSAREIEKHTMVIEYLGEMIRNEVAEKREQYYEDQNRGIYMFRLDDGRVIDASLTGGLARYINHSCNPNCVAEVVQIDREYRIIIFASRRIARGEELSYDYKFDIEDDQHKIPCLCGAPNCKKWMN